MAITAPTAIDDAFRKRFARSAELYARSREAIAGGITHDSRNFAPFPIYIDRADGSRKWDVDGNELVDHWMGHGSLLLGHNNPTVTPAGPDPHPKGHPLGGPRLAVARPQQPDGNRGRRRADPQGHPLRRLSRARGRLGGADRALEAQRGVGGVPDVRHRADQPDP